MHYKTKVKGKCLLKFEALNTMIIFIEDVQIAMTIEGRGEWRIQLIRELDQNKKTDYTANEGEKQVSTEDGSVRHNDYLYRGRANCNDD